MSINNANYQSSENSTDQKSSGAYTTNSKSPRNPSGQTQSVQPGASQLDQVQGVQRQDQNSFEQNNAIFHKKAVNVPQSNSHDQPSQPNSSGFSTKNNGFSVAPSSSMKNLQSIESGLIQNAIMNSQNESTFKEAKKNFNSQAQGYGKNAQSPEFSSVGQHTFVAATSEVDFNNPNMTSMHFQYPQTQHSAHALGQFQQYPYPIMNQNSEMYQQQFVAQMGNNHGNLSQGVDFRQMPGQFQPIQSNMPFAMNSSGGSMIQNDSTLNAGYVGHGFDQTLVPQTGFMHGVDPRSNYEQQNMTPNMQPSTLRLGQQQNSSQLMTGFDMAKKMFDEVALLRKEVDKLKKENEKLEKSKNNDNSIEEINKVLQKQIFDNTNVNKDNSQQNDIQFGSLKCKILDPKQIIDADKKTSKSSPIKVMNSQSQHSDSKTKSLSKEKQITTKPTIQDSKKLVSKETKNQNKITKDDPQDKQQVEKNSGTLSLDQSENNQYFDDISRKESVEIARGVKRTYSEVARSSNAETRFAKIESKSVNDTTQKKDRQTSSTSPIKMTNMKSKDLIKKPDSELENKKSDNDDECVVKEWNQNDDSQQFPFSSQTKLKTNDLTHNQGSISVPMVNKGQISNENSKNSTVNQISLDHNSESNPNIRQDISISNGAVDLCKTQGEAQYNKGAKVYPAEIGPKRESPGYNGMPVVNNFNQSEQESLPYLLYYDGKKSNCKSTFEKIKGTNAYNIHLKTNIHINPDSKFIIKTEIVVCMPPGVHLLVDKPEETEQNKDLLFVKGYVSSFSSGFVHITMKNKTSERINIEPGVCIGKISFVRDIECIEAKLCQKVYESFKDHRSTNFSEQYFDLMHNYIKQNPKGTQFVDIGANNDDKESDKKLKYNKKGQVIKKSKKPVPSHSQIQEELEKYQNFIGKKFSEEIENLAARNNSMQNKLEK